MVRFEVEAEYKLEDGCRCLCCFEATGRWIVKDMEDKLEDVYFATEDAAYAWVREFMDKRNHEKHNENTKVSK